MIGGLPTYDRSYETDSKAWAKALIKFAETYLQRNQPNELISFALEDMLILHPAYRGTARQCRSKGEKLANLESAGPVVVESVETDDRDGSQPATPKALPSDALSSFTKELEETRPGFLRSLAQRGDVMIDSIMGLASPAGTGFDWLSSSAVQIKRQWEEVEEDVEEDVDSRSEAEGGAGPWKRRYSEQ